MQTTSNERREVAEKLRALAHDNQGALGFASLSHVMDEGTRILGIAGLPDCAHVLTRYADLIDPTCKVESVEPIRYGEIDEKIMDVYKLTCGHCVVRQCGDTPPSYCDECGARVV